MANLLIELKCPDHGMERFAVKVVRKYNVNPTVIMPKYRTRPKHELSGIIVGRNVHYSEARDYLMQHFKETGLIDSVISVRVQR